MFAYAGRKDTIKACIYVKDLARVMLAMAENKDAEKSNFIIVATIQVLPIEQITNTILKVTA
jgi:nucleoside-diphosphate-sugar epimerase